MITSKIVNVVATAELNQTIELSKLERIKNFVYNSKNYKGRVAYFKKQKMVGKVSLFSSGKMISVGTKSEEQAFKELRESVEYLVKKDIIKPVKINPKTQNIVVTIDFGKLINLDELALNSNIIYEPEQFPAAILRINEPVKVSVLIFASGKLVLTALKSSIQIEPTIRTVQQFIETNQYL